MSSCKRRFYLVLLALAAMAAFGAAVLPWTRLIEQRLVTALEAQGFRNVRLTLADVGLAHVALKDVSLGDNPPLTLASLVLNTPFWDLWAGRVQDVALGGLAFEARRGKDGWKLPGLEAWPASSADHAGFALPLSPAEIAAIPVKSLRLDDSRARVVTDAWQLDLPLGFAWSKEPFPKLTYAAANARLKTQGVEVALGSLSAELSPSPDPKEWTGPWHAENIAVAGAEPAVPPLAGGGTMFARADRIGFEGRIESADHAYVFVFSGAYALPAPGKAEGTIKEAAMPWQSGTLALEDAQFSSDDRKPLTLTLKVRAVSAGALLQRMTGKQASATGTVSGALPLTILPDGTLLAHQGSLQADAPGVINLSPDAIPGDNEQVAFVRDVLKNFHYKLLSISMDSGADRRLAVRMTLEGSNPDVASGRAVKVNVHLSGDVLDFARQNLLWLTNPQKLLEQGDHAKP